MAEKIISIEGIELLDFYGVANSNFNRVCDLFPKLKLVARGNAIKAIGTDEEIARLEGRMGALGEYYGKYGHISPSVIQQIFSGGLPEEGSILPKDVIVYGNNGLIVKARTENQRKMVELYGSNDLLFAVGPAGSGKTYTAIALAVGALKNREVKRIILTRPAVEAGERLGFLPGDLKEKLDPYLQPLYDALNDMIPPAKLQKFLEEGVVQIAPLAYMRGRTLDNAFVILDEAQNTTLPQIKMFLTRMGRNAKFIVTGDMTQIDLPHKSDSGLGRTLEMLRGVDGIGVVEFGKKDIIRHALVSRIVKAFEGAENKE
ncbi:MAG: PhoH family protein [Tidjanibacter sp.]|nr:PhoH family protein [Tidjanibacter sp.]MBR3683088.1 PhoH family protein [Tidjanibacter sp.]MBR3853187.1 PhoH family protein [Tidjanibacter sp.]MBR7130310.1 PhoH family protein [Tidjanibacter sp.]